jgi:Protein of unknown function (DUF2635)
MLTIYPIPGRLVRDPTTGREVTEATVVPESDSFWLRRIADGDVGTEAPKTAKATQGAEK